MTGADLKAKWASGRASAGVWIVFADPTVAEVIGGIGLDWVIIDAEHVALDLQTLQGLLIALATSPIVPLVRVPSNDMAYIKRTLDMGAEGVLVPHVDSADDARAAVAACKYPPMGIRGAGPRRAGHYGRDEDAYLRDANDRTIVLAMIESAAAVRNIDEILAVPGLDGIVIGPLDLAASMGLLPAFDHPDVEQAIETVVARARAAGIAFGYGRVPADPLQWLDRGAHIIRLGDDQGFVHQGAQAALAAFQRAVAGRR